VKSLLTLDSAGGRAHAAAALQRREGFGLPADPRLLSREEMQACRRRLAAYVEPPPAELLAKLRKHLERIETRQPLDIIQRSDCLKYIGELALKNR
jgi:hypothetical protein